MQSLVKECTYSINSTKQFIEKFHRNKVKFDAKKHIILSFDAISLYTNVNVHRTINHVIKRLYESPHLLLQYDTDKKTGNRIELDQINKKDLRKLFIKVLIDFNKFRAGEKVFAQKRDS